MPSKELLFLKWWFRQQLYVQILVVSHFRLLDLDVFNGQDLCEKDDVITLL
jgi:hypothetical protein